MPSLRWRLAEYQALTRLPDAAKNRVVPFVTVTKPEYDHENQRLKRTIQEQVGPFAEQYKLKWGTRPAWIDFQAEIELEPLSDSKLPVAHVFDKLHELSSSAVPVITLDSPPSIQDAVAAITQRDRRGVGIRIGFKHVMTPDCGAALSALLAKLSVDHASADLILDLVAPSYEPYDDFAEGLLAALEELGNLADYRSFVLVGSAYPEAVALAKSGGELDRHDWNFYRSFCGKLPEGAVFPAFGDYTIVPPSFSADVDFRMIKTPGKLIYTSGPKWIVRKGGAFRDNREQMHDHCLHIMNSGKFRIPIPLPQAVL